jgi:hypothetical protein
MLLEATMAGCAWPERERSLGRERRRRGRRVAGGRWRGGAVAWKERRCLWRRGGDWSVRACVGCRGDRVGVDAVRELGRREA